MLIIQRLIQLLIRVTLRDFMLNLLVFFEGWDAVVITLILKSCQGPFLIHVLSISRDELWFFVRSKENFISVARQM